MASEPIVYDLGIYGEVAVYDRLLTKEEMAQAVRFAEENLRAPVTVPPSPVLPPFLVLIGGTVFQVPTGVTQYSDLSGRAPAQ